MHVSRAHRRPMQVQVAVDGSPPPPRVREDGRRLAQVMTYSQGSPIRNPGIKKLPTLRRGAPEQF